MFSLKKCLSLALAGSMSLMVGCASFKSNVQPIASEELIRTPNAEKLVVSYSWKMTSTNTRPLGWVSTTEEQLNEIFEKELLGTGCCVVMKSGMTPDVIIKGTMDQDRNTMSFWEAIARGPAQGTFAIIPAWDNVYFDMSIDASRPAMNRNFSHKLSDHQFVLQWFGVFPLFFLGFDPFITESEIVTNLHRNFIYRMKRNGMLTR